MRSLHLVSSVFVKALGEKPQFKPPNNAGQEFGEPALELLNEEKREKVIALIKSGFTEGR